MVKCGSLAANLTTMISFWTCGLLILPKINGIKLISPWIQMFLLQAEVDTVQAFIKIIWSYSLASTKSPMSWTIWQPSISKLESGSTCSRNQICPKNSRIASIRRVGLRTGANKVQAAHRGSVIFPWRKHLPSRMYKLAQLIKVLRSLSRLKRRKECKISWRLRHSKSRVPRRNRRQILTTIKF